ncbi:MAG: rRNA maturation RNase YbeY [Gammaproteobacteria bacterium]|nr:rRNA maturation RNase YbeY [Gammaproteobacteria bacterium]MDE2345024.1 rRNA maturation RNase YbeY [Gammaproteobacteria bacterium]
MPAIERKPRVAVQIATQEKRLPSSDDFKRWVSAALEDRAGSVEMTVRLVDEDEALALNRRYRHKDVPTNVLSFPASIPAGVNCDLLGDLVLCAPVLIREAAEQGKPAAAHWAHLTVHGVLHLLGYEHDTAYQAKQMEALETVILARLGYPDPYLI